MARYCSRTVGVAHPVRRRSPAAGARPRRSRSIRSAGAPRRPGEARARAAARSRPRARCPAASAPAGVPSSRSARASRRPGAELGLGTLDLAAQPAVLLLLARPTPSRPRHAARRRRARRSRPASRAPALGGAGLTQLAAQGRDLGLVLVDLRLVRGADLAHGLLDLLEPLAQPGRLRLGPLGGVVPLGELGGGLLDDGGPVLRAGSARRARHVAAASSSPSVEVGPPPGWRPARGTPRRRAPR